MFKRETMASPPAAPGRFRLIFPFFTRVRSILFGGARTRSRRRPFLARAPLLLLYQVSFLIEHLRPAPPSHSVSPFPVARISLSLYIEFEARRAHLSTYTRCARLRPSLGEAAGAAEAAWKKGSQEREREREGRTQRERHWSGA